MHTEDNESAWTRLPRAWVAKLGRPKAIALMVVLVIVAVFFGIASYEHGGDHGMFVVSAIVTMYVVGMAMALLGKRPRPPADPE